MYQFKCVNIVQVKRGTIDWHCVYSDTCAIGHYRYNENNNHCVVFGVVGSCVHVILMPQCMVYYCCNKD